VLKSLEDNAAQGSTQLTLLALKEAFAQGCKPSLLFAGKQHLPLRM
jgi:hypothetical protein